MPKSAAISAAKVEAPGLAKPGMRSERSFTLPGRTRIAAYGTILEQNFMDVDYSKTEEIAPWIRDAINTSMAIEADDAKSAGSLGFVARALVQATMPYKDPKVSMFVRRNGDFTLTIMGGFEGLVPYGIYPRLLMSWITTEAVRNQSPEIELGDSLNAFLRNVLEIGRGGGRTGASTRVSEQMARLFGSLITARYGGKSDGRGFSLRNVAVVESADVSDRTLWQLDNLADLQGNPPDRAAGKDGPDGDSSLWVPQAAGQAGRWRSVVRLSSNFYNECIKSPVPMDLRAYKALRRSPLAMDVYTWLTYRMSYIRRPTPPIPWEGLLLQFGSNFASADRQQALRDFRKAFLAALKTVQIVYPTARVTLIDKGVVLHPSPPHIPMKSSQRKLF
jgi:hypothetical protein